VRAHRGRPAPDLASLGENDDTDEDAVPERRVGSMTVTGDGPPVVREKVHSARPMTLDQALYEMELVGHDFYLFVDQETRRPAVVYRRRGYDYGVIALDVSENG
jgi:hypothetical protein